MRLFFPLWPKKSRAQKQDQSWILAQNFLSCGNLSAGFFREALFRTLTRHSVKYRAS